MKCTNDTSKPVKCNAKELLAPEAITIAFPIDFSFSYESYENSLFSASL